MKIKLVGFKVGQSRPTANKTIINILPQGTDLLKPNIRNLEGLGEVLYKILEKSDFVSIRRIE